MTSSLQESFPTVELGRVYTTPGIGGSMRNFPTYISGGGYFGEDIQAVADRIAEQCIRDRVSRVIVKGALEDGLVELKPDELIAVAAQVRARPAEQGLTTEVHIEEDEE